MQQFMHYLAVMHMGRGGRHRMDQLGAAMGTEMRFHAEVPDTVHSSFPRRSVAAWRAPIW